MDIFVFVKQVPETAEADLELNDRATDVEKDDLVLGINEWDNYAVEEAIRLKEAHGGRVVVATLGGEEAEEVLRRSLAMGADEALRIDGEDFEAADEGGIARALCAALKGRKFDLILVGAQSSDNGSGCVGPMLAEKLGLPYAALAVKIEPRGGGIVVDREVESNTLERVKVPLPALVTIQTGINQPRYVSIMGIRKVRKVEIARTDAGELGIADEIGAQASSVLKKELFAPEEGKGARILEGSLKDICEETARIIREQGDPSHA